MAYFNEFPHSRTYDSDLGWLIRNMRQVIETVENYNELHFADPVVWNITTQYETATVVRDGIDGPLYISKKPVPAGINITNGEYWEILGSFDQMFSGVIKNVQDYGAVGIPGADYTEQVQAAIDDGNIIYFPAGEYSFKNVTITKPVYLFGDGETTIFKPQHRTETSNQYANMIVSTNDITLDNIKFVGDNSVETQTGTQYYQAAIVQATGSRFRMTRCIIDKIFDTYHLSQGDLEFFDRNGLLLYVHDTDTAEIDHCIFHEYGGEELIWISRALARFGDPASILIHDNEFTDRVPLASGGLIDGGSAINVLGGNVSFNNNYAENYYERGSFVNLLGNTVTLTNNTIINSDMASVFDCCEGYYAKNETVKAYNNYTTDKNGITLYTIKAQARILEVVGNHFEAICPIKTYACIDDSIAAYTQYKATYENWNDYNSIRVIDNQLILSHEATQAANSGISLGQSNSAAGSRGELKYCRIAGNTIRKAAAFANVYNSIYTTFKLLKSEIVNNSIDNLGSGTPSGSRRNLISLAEAGAVGSEMFILDNVITENSGNSVTIITGVAAALSNTHYYTTGNVLVSAATIKTFIGSSYASNVTGDYNIGFSALAG